MVKLHLFTPGRIGSMELRTRVVMAPIGTHMGGDGGEVTQRLKDYHATRARGGVGLTIVETSFADSATGAPGSHMILLDDDRFLPGLKELADAIHSGGAKAAIQINHGGIGAAIAEPFSPTVRTLPDGRCTHEMTKEEIAEQVRKFASAAARVKEAGFDGVEIHGAHAYLVASFLSPATNHRQDEYGGTVGKRARFIVEILHAVRDVVGEDYPLWARFNGCEWIPNGFSNEEAVAIAKLMEAGGADAVHISGWGLGTQRQQLSLPTIPGGLIPLAAEVKKNVSISVIAVGMITPELAEAALKEGKADFIAFARSLLVDPELPLKVEQSRQDEIRPCIACMHCLDSVRGGGELECTVNPALLRERELEITKTDKPKKVLVIGGGPAGMESARIAALRGHQVTLWERESRLGGQLNQAVVPPQKEPLKPLLPYYENQLKELKVPVKTGEKADVAAVKAAIPDAIVLATGIKPFVPDIPGIKSSQVVQATDILDGKAKAGQKVVIIGGELVGCETADFLSQKGKQITVARRGKEMAQKVTPSARSLLLQRLEQQGVRLLPGVSYEEITEKGLVVSKEGKHELLEADTIVIAAGSTANQDLACIEGIPVNTVGDCKEPRGIKEAIAEGWKAGSSI